MRDHHQYRTTAAKEKKHHNTKFLCQQHFHSTPQVKTELSVLKYTTRGESVEGDTSEKLKSLTLLAFIRNHVHTQFNFKWEVVGKEKNMLLISHLDFIVQPYHRFCNNAWPPLAGTTDPLTMDTTAQTWPGHDQQADVGTTTDM